MGASGGSSVVPDAEKVGHWNHDSEDCAGEISEDMRALLGIRERATCVIC